MSGNRRKSRQSASGGGESWLTTYSDTVTLLLCFFAVLYSFSSLDIERFRAIMAAFQGAIGVLDAGSALDPRTSISGANSAESRIAIERPVSTPEVATALAVIQEFIESEGLLDAITTEVSERGIVIHFTDRVLFDTGEATLKPEAVAVLRSLGERALSAWPHLIRVEGHTDNVPIANTRFPSNWELSTARAARVVRFLIAEAGIAPERLSAAGYGEFRPIDTNATEAGRSRNRRVDIVLLSSQYSTFEPAAIFVP